MSNNFVNTIRAIQQAGQPAPCPPPDKIELGSMPSEGFDNRADWRKWARAQVSETAPKPTTPSPQTALEFVTEPPEGMDARQLEACEYLARELLGRARRALARAQRTGGETLRPFITVSTLENALGWVQNERKTLAV